ncbi:MAG: TfoX/Sxy family protein [Nitrospira sp.]|nr:TfoX/Sxy family protein [Nitrospira sp.]
MATKHDGFKDFVLDQLADMKQVRCRAMFGGYGLYQHTIFFGIIHTGRLYFKVTPATIERYKAHGMSSFRPNSKQTLTSFYEVPIEIIEDAEQLMDWAVASVNQ